MKATSEVAKRKCEKKTTLKSAQALFFFFFGGVLFAKVFYITAMIVLILRHNKTETLK